LAEGVRYAIAAVPVDVRSDLDAHVGVRMMPAASVVLRVGVGLFAVLTVPLWLLLWSAWIICGDLLGDCQGVAQMSIAACQATARSMTLRHPLHTGLRGSYPHAQRLLADGARHLAYRVRPSVDQVAPAPVMALARGRDHDVVALVSQPALLLGFVCHAGMVPSYV